MFSPFFINEIFYFFLINVFGGVYYSLCLPWLQGICFKFLGKRIAERVGLFVDDFFREFMVRDKGEIFSA